MPGGFRAAALLTLFHELLEHGGERRLSPAVTGFFHRLRSLGSRPVVFFRKMN